MAQLRLFFLGTILLALANSCAHHQTQQDQPPSSKYSRIDHESTQRAPLETLRVRAMEDVFVIKDYRPGKNSFVENAERHPGAWTSEGFRYTLLDESGQGSVRHIWTTRGEGDPYFTWEFYIDGEETPSISTTDEELRRAMEAYPVPLAVANSVPFGNRDFNFFLPIPFEKSIRIDVVQRVDAFWLWFCQIDYRLGDDELSGTQMVGPNENETNIRYVGLPKQRRSFSEDQPQLIEQLFHQTTIAPGETACVASLEGPAIVRELRLQWPHDVNAQLRVRYDGEESYAIQSPINKFFGPFQGVSFYQHAPNDSSCYLPMPFRKQCEIFVRNDGDAPIHISGKANVERVHSFSPSWAYLHAKYQKTNKTDGHHLHQVIYICGRGHFLGMTLYNTGHDHGGGDFAVVDGEGSQPAFLHGVNGEDYFTFAWFGRGAHHPYAVAHSNEEGRYRHHFENPYPFQKSFSMEWGAFPGISPESVCVWYQDSPQDTTLAYGARSESTRWDCFGPVPIPYDDSGTSIGDVYAVLPTVDVLDAGKQFEVRGVEQFAQTGWKQQWTTGPMLNLTYLGRPEIEINPENELGGTGHAFLARCIIHSDEAKLAPYLLSHDDPLEVWINGERVYSERNLLNGFQNRKVYLPLQTGDNEIVVRLTNYFNRTFNWAGFLLRPIAP